MAVLNLNYLSLSTQESLALGRMTQLSLEAFKTIHFPFGYQRLLQAILHIVELGSVALTHASPTDITAFSLEMDTLWGVLTEAKYLIHVIERHRGSPT